uniref:Uncharacterized protein n=1 Tax=Arundo donax TaxID=35708 RepID=A0A0A8ZDN7_ARUDO
MGDPIGGPRQPRPGPGPRLVSVSLTGLSTNAGCCSCHV